MLNVLLPESQTNGNASEELDDDASDDGSSTEESTDSDSDALANAITNAISDGAQKSDDSSGDESDVSDSKDLDDADDDEMAQVDAALAKVFADRKKAKSDERGMDPLICYDTNDCLASLTQRQHFKFRVLDLLEIVIKVQSSNPIMYGNKLSVKMFTIADWMLLSLF